MHVGMGHCKCVASVRKLLGLPLESLHHHGYVVFRLELPSFTAYLRRRNAMEPARLTIRTVWPVVQDASKDGQNRKRNCRVWVLSVFHSKQRYSLIRNVKAGTCSGRRVCLNVLNFWVPVGRSPDEPRVFLSLFYSAFILSAAWGLQSAISLVSSGNTFILYSVDRASWGNCGF
jgi:hypothetical protein